MRTIGLLFFLLMLSLPLARKYEPAAKPGKLFSIHIPPTDLPFFSQSAKTNTIDTAELKQTDWYANALNYIEESEYEIKYDAASGMYGSPNRINDLRSFYTGKTFTIVPRIDNTDKWKLELTTLGVYANKKLLFTPVADASITESGKKIQFNHDNFITEYVNSKEGVRQNFIIKKEPVAKADQLTVKLKANKDWFINKISSKEIHFAKVDGDNIEKKITYNSLKAWDANNKELAAAFSVYNNQIGIEVNTKDAVYPITIDPLSTGTSGTYDWIGDDAGQPSGFFGYAVSSAGDVNGDGYSDVVVGCYGFDAEATNEGRIFVYHGSATGLPSSPTYTRDDANKTGALFGRSVACAGDVNGDGYSDVIVGADNYDDGANLKEGWAFIYYGSASGLGFFYGSTLKDADQAAAQFGFNVAGAGDVNGDGYSDVIVGAYTYDDDFANEGKAFVYYGSAGGIITTAAVTLAPANQVDAKFGISVAGAGDINGDGYSDVIIGANEYDDGANIDEGQAYVYYGNAAGLSTSPGLILSDANMGDAQFGFSVAGAGDVNGDGYSDVIVGATEYDDGANTDEGVAFIYYGSSAGLSATYNAIADDANQADANFGAKVACAGDVNGDGYSDVIIGAYTYDDNIADEGVAFVYYGSNTGLSASPDCMLDDSNGSGGSFGYSVASAGDINGDGYSDVIIGAYSYLYMGNLNYGLSYVYHGSPGGIIASPDSYADANQAGAQFGTSVACAGDVNGDGFSDVLIGAWNFDDGTYTNVGRAWLYFGTATGLSTIPASVLDDCDQSNAFFGETVAGAGDVNGDGYSDVIICADSYDDGSNTDEGRAYIYHGSALGLGAVPNSILDDGDQSSINFGVCGTSAGDVNGDGYGDVIVGAILYDDGPFTNEGRAFVYFGAVTGLSSSPDNILDDADQNSAFFGWSVACAGDVNGDGYSDVIVGALNYTDGANAAEGRVFIYHGSASGLSPTPNSTPDDADQAGAQFGESVAGAGDVNGDGYGDVIIGAKNYDDGANGNEGRAFVYYGSSAGIGPLPSSTPDDANQANALLGISVASAGDVNGDGYSDVIIGARYYDGNVTDEGGAFIYLGSSTGLTATPAIILDDANESFSSFGYTVAGAGDVNGDGYSDVIVGSHQCDDGTIDEGKAFLYYGNAGKGSRNNLRLYNSDLITPIQQSNMNDPNLFGAGLYAKSFQGKQKGKLVYQTVKNGVAFTGTPITNSTAYTAQQPAYTDLGLTGFELKSQIAKQIPAKATYIRARVKYDLVTSITGQVYGPWRYPEGFMRGRRDVGSVALPVKFISFTAVKENGSARLKWTTSNEEQGVRFEVQHSLDGIHFNSLGMVDGRNQPTNDYEWLHSSPANGNNFYRIKAVENNKTVFSPVRILQFDDSFITIIYPDPVKSGQRLTIKNEKIGKDKTISISIFSMTGQMIFKKDMKAVTDGMIFLDVPEISGGLYLIQIDTGQQVGKSKMIVENK